MSAADGLHQDPCTIRRKPGEEITDLGQKRTRIGGEAREDDRKAQAKGTRALARW